MQCDLGGSGFQCVLPWNGYELFYLSSYVRSKPSVFCHFLLVRDGAGRWNRLALDVGLVMRFPFLQCEFLLSIK